MNCNSKKRTIEALVLKCVKSARTAATYLPNCTTLDPLHVTFKGFQREEVTAYDKKLEEVILDMLIHTGSQDSYLGEETGGHVGKSGIRWIIDPIDGTSNFARRIPAYAISIAAELDGEIVAGAIYDPSHDELFSAGLGLGARCNGNKIRCSKVVDLSDSIISTGFSKKTEIRRKQAQIISRVLNEVRDVRSCGAAALELCWLAAGKIDAYYEHGLCYWDFAAGALIADQAGAAVDVRDDFVISSSPGISQNFNKLIKYGNTVQF